MINIQKDLKTLLSNMSLIVPNPPLRLNKLFRAVRLVQKSAYFFTCSIIPPLPRSNAFKYRISELCLSLFVCFGYVINDAIDFSNDIDSSRHQTRPFVKGLIEIPYALILTTTCSLAPYCLPGAAASNYLALIVFTNYTHIPLIAKRYASWIYLSYQAYAKRDIGCTLTNTFAHRKYR